MDESAAVPGTRQDALTLLAADHREVQQAFARMEQARRSGDIDDQRRLAQQVVHALSVHAVAQEEILYPLMADVLPDGQARVQQALAEHGRVIGLLERVDDAQPGSDDQRRAWDELVDVVGEHIRTEETREFPELRERADTERLYELGERLAKAMAAAPTHPHPLAPTAGPVEPGERPATSAAKQVREALRGS